MITNTPANHQALLPRQPLNQSPAGLAHPQCQAVAITADCSTPAAAVDQQRAQQQKTIVGRHICNDVQMFNNRRKHAASECALEQTIFALSIGNKSLNDSNTAMSRQLQLMRLDNIVLEEMLQFLARATGIPLDPAHNNDTIFWGAAYPLEEPVTEEIDLDYRQQLEQIVDRL